MLSVISSLYSRFHSWCWGMYAWDSQETKQQVFLCSLCLGTVLALRLILAVKVFESRSSWRKRSSEVTAAPPLITAGSRSITMLMSLMLLETHTYTRAHTHTHTHRHTDTQTHRHSHTVKNNTSNVITCFVPSHLMIPVLYVLVLYIKLKCKTV